MITRSFAFLLSLVVVAALASVSLSSGAVAEAAGDASSAGAPVALQAPVDACGFEGFDVPDSGDFFDFFEACAAHDACYGLGGTPADRRACDRAFLADMLASCQEGYTGLNRVKCQSLAWVYFAGVRLGGWLTF